MKFQLFGRLKDEDSSKEPTQDSNTADISMGSGLERTVERMFSQGYSEGEIQDELDGQYSRSEIQQAINRAVTSSAAGDSFEEGPKPMEPYSGGEEAVSPMDEDFNNQEQEEMNPGQDISQEPQMNMQRDQQAAPQGQNVQNTGVEELVETIVAENFEMVEAEFENVYREIDEVKEKVEELDQRVHDLEVRDDEDQTQFIQKMDEIEDNIDSYQSRIGGLEKAFQQVLPSLVDNVRELTDLVQEIKQERGIETSSEVSQEDIDKVDLEEW